MALQAASNTLRGRLLWRAATGCLNAQFPAGAGATSRELRTPLMKHYWSANDACWRSELLGSGGGDQRITPPSHFCFSSSAAGNQAAGTSSKPDEDDDARSPEQPAVSQNTTETPPHSPTLTATTDNDVFEYTGPFAAAVKRVKMLSVTSLGITAFASPIILALQADAAMTVSAKAGIAVTLCGFGAFTTGLLHWFASPYIISLKYNRSSEMVEAQTYTFFSQKMVTHFHISEVEPSDSFSPVSSFKAKGKTFYVDADNFADKELLERLTPPSEDEKAIRAAAEQMQQQQQQKQEAAEQQ